MVERFFHNLKEGVAGIFREPPLSKDPLWPPELKESNLPAGVSVCDYYKSRNDFFFRILLSRLRVSQATGKVLGKEQIKPISSEAGKRKIFDRMGYFGILAAICTVGTCAHPALAVPALAAYGGLIWNFRKLENLERQTSVSEKRETNPRC